jgi:hypothetical protein
MKIVNYRCSNEDCSNELEELVDNEEYETVLLNPVELDCSCGAKMKLFLFKNNSQVYKYLS